MMDLVAVLFLLAAVLYGAAPLLRKYKKTARVGCWLTLLCPILGAGLVAVSALLAGGMSGGTPDAVAWAKDAYSLSLRVGGIFTAAVGGVCLIAALTEHRLRRTRIAAALAGAWLILAVGYAYGVICVGRDVNPAPYVWMCALGYSGLIGVGQAVDAWRERKKSRGKT